MSRRLLDWLTELHSSNELTPDSTSILHRTVDALVAKGSKRAASLQLALERQAGRSRLGPQYRAVRMST